LLFFIIVLLSFKKLSILSVIYENLFLCSGIDLSYFHIEYTDIDKKNHKESNISKCLTFAHATKNIIKETGTITIIVQKSGCAHISIINTHNINIKGKNQS
jgi:hypothetical protein